MPDNGENTAPVEGAEQGTEQVTEPAMGEENLGDAGKQALDRMKAERNEAAKRAKALESELEKFRQASMSETEKAIAEAEAKGRTAAATDFGKRLAKAEIQTAAATAGRDLGGVFDYLDLSRFVREDGEPDTKAVEAFVNGLPDRTPSAPSFDGGPRASAPASGDMNQALRRAAGRA